MEVAFSLVMIGLNNSGKSTILKSIKNSTEEIFPTAGFAIEFINIQKIQKPILCYDCSGEGIHRKFWKTFYSQVDAIVFVLDATDIGRFKYSKAELNEILKDYVVAQRKLPICIMLNKCDERTQSKEIYFQAFEIEALQAAHPNKIYLKQTSGYTKEGLDECFLWLQQSI